VLTYQTGTISSSGVTEAIWDYWAYFEPIRVYAPPTCVSYTQKITHMVDNILIGLNDSTTTKELKGLFGLPNVTYDNDFASVLSNGIYGWQNKNWDPAVNYPDFDNYCGNISSTSITYPATESLKSTAQDVLKKGGYASEVDALTVPLLNYIGWLTAYLYENYGNCSPQQDECYSTHIISSYELVDYSQNRPWPYQYCTQWGFLQTGSGVPADQLPLISRTLDLAWNALICEYAFNITTPANVTAINKYGGFNISYPRLAFIDGEWDPWRPATPHASPFNTTAVNRTSTISEPFHLIADAVHHWDENGLFANETVNYPPSALLPPLPIREVHAEEVAFVLEWMLEWDLQCGAKQELKERIPTIS
jgi:hypothetical protein